jgi:hypothetical protein
MTAPPSNASAEIPSAGLISGATGPANAFAEKQSAMSTTGSTIFNVFTCCSFELGSALNHFKKPITFIGKLALLTWAEARLAKTLALQASAEDHDCAAEQCQRGDSVGWIDFRCRSSPRRPGEGTNGKAKCYESDRDSDLQVFQLFTSRWTRNLNTRLPCFPVTSSKKSVSIWDFPQTGGAFAGSA